MLEMYIEANLRAIKTEIEELSKSFSESIVVDETPASHKTIYVNGATLKGTISYRRTSDYNKAERTIEKINEFFKKHSLPLQVERKYKTIEFYRRATYAPPKKYGQKDESTENFPLKNQGDYEELHAAELVLNHLFEKIAKKCGKQHMHFNERCLDKINESNQQRK
jgi:hypothetical protein